MARRKKPLAESPVGEQVPPEGEVAASEPVVAKVEEESPPEPAPVPELQEPVEAEEEPDFGDGPSAQVRRAFWKRGAGFLNYLVQSQADPSEENIHELRVSSRRLVAALELFEEMIGRRPMRRLRSDLKKIRRLCGALREVQVHLEAFGQDEMFTGFVHVHNAQLDKLTKKTAKKLSKFSPPKLEAKLELIDSLVTALIEGAEHDHNEHLALLAQPFIETRAYAEYAAQQMDLERAATVHAVRLALKTLRYQAEFLEDVEVVQGSSEAWHAVRAFHQAAGKIQDLETLTRWLDQQWAASPPPRDLQLKVLGRLWKDRQPHLAALDHDLPLDDFEIREDLVFAEEPQEAESESED
jgi:CHAD domain-containing protein